MTKDGLTLKYAAWRLTELGLLDRPGDLWGLPPSRQVELLAYERVRRLQDGIDQPRTPGDSGG